jgi:acylphosphatase
MIQQNEVHTLHVYIEGHVQGVGFRYFVKEIADRLHLYGWVRNRFDGSVELTAEGSQESLVQLLQMVREGPSRSMVTNIKTDWSQSEAKYSQFSFLPTE